MNKPHQDILTGISKREKASSYLNHILLLHGNDITVMRLHDALKLMTPAEKVKNNKLQNYNAKVDMDHAMSLYYRIMKSNVSDGIPLIFAYQSSGGFYLKVPAAYIYMPQKYLEYLRDSEYFFLVVSKDSRDDYFKYSGLISFTEIVNHPEIWQYTMGKKSNKNRLQFKGKIKMSTVTYSHPEELNIFGESLITKLEDLFKKQSK